jgi:excisionase family DNA binding protein
MLSKPSMPKRMKSKLKMPDLLTLSEACEILKCHPNTLRQWDKKGILPAIRIGEKRIRRYNREDIINFTKHTK